MISTYDCAQKKLIGKLIAVGLTVVLLPIMALYSYGAEPSAAKPDIAGVWAEIAYVRFQAAQGYDLQSDARKQTAFRPREPQDPATPADELELAGDEKSLASEEYQRAAKQWEKAAEGFTVGVEANRAKTAKENAALAWQAAQRTVVDAIELYRTAEDYYEASNDLPKKTAVLGKIATSLERLIEISTNVPWSSVSRSMATAADPDNIQEHG
jgi:hypothetical protein